MTFKQIKFHSQQQQQPEIFSTAFVIASSFQHLWQIVSLNADVFITGLLLTEEHISTQNLFITTEDHNTGEVSEERDRKMACMYGLQGENGA